MHFDPKNSAELDRCPTCGSVHMYRGLSESVIADVLAMCASGMKRTEIAKTTGIKYRTVRAICAHDRKGSDCKSCASRRSWSDPSAQRIATIPALVAAGAAARSGKRLSIEHKNKLKAARAGKKPALGMRHSESTKAEYSRSRRGRKVSAATREKISMAHHARHGTEPHEGPTVNQLGRWAYEVIKRDGGKCRYCGIAKIKPKYLNAHHVLSKAKWPGLALSVDNGITLCKPCHEEHHKINHLI